MKTTGATERVREGGNGREERFKERVCHAHMMAHNYNLVN